MKGQVFIITSALILLSLLLIRINTMTFEIREEKLFYENFLNLKNELINTIDLSLINQEILSTNLDDFIGFSTDLFKKRGYGESVNYSISTSGNLRTIYLNISFKSDDSEILENLIINREMYS